ncbi:mechanosensitive ion channel domain-containing protein [Flavitalea sp.]|nr:mechanosensitive ion channel domain-containing protein [Flavitalea sp.]
MKKRYGQLVTLFLIMFLTGDLFAQETPERGSERNNRRVDSLKRQDPKRRSPGDQNRQSDSVSRRDDQGIFWQSDSSRRRDSSYRRRDSSSGRFDSSYRRNDSSFRRSDSGRARGGMLNSLFADSNTLTTSDYQLQIEKTFLALNNIENNGHLGPAITNIQKDLTESTNVLAVLKDNVRNNNNALNLKNLQVFKTLLQNIQQDLRKDRKLLDSNENKMVRLRSDLRQLITDTILRQVMRNDTLRDSFGTQLRDLRRAFVSTTRQVRESLTAINFLQTQTSSNSISTNQLLENITNLEASSAKRIFSKEYNYLWEADTTVLTEQTKQSFEKVYEGEKKAMNYYFTDNGYKTFLLLFMGLLFCLWLNRNIRYLRAHKDDHHLTGNEFEYLKFGVIPSALVVVFSIAPVFDLHAPSTYIETMQFLLLCVVTYLMYKKWSGRVFTRWLGLGILFICFTLTGHAIEPGFFQRSLLILLNISSILIARSFISSVGHTHHLKRFLRLAGYFHHALHLTSILCNISGRYTLAQILSNAAIFGITQAVGLAIFSKIWLESILSQMVASRLRNGLPATFEHSHVINSFSRPIKFLIGVLWLIVLTTNLNLYTAAYSSVLNILQKPRHIGSAYFTLGGIALFFMIIWLAHLLQKYIGYFFGDTGTDEDAQNKVQRSRLLIARLVLLCVGYLLAVTASGIPVDKITIVLGALGVGIGLGLQNIVSNFVSGIILIFDRPLQIGDLVEIGDKTGKVREIGLRSSTLLTQDGAEVIIPNGDLLSRQIVNWTLSNNQRRLELDLTVKGTDDMELVSSVIKNSIAESTFITKNRDPQILITKILDNGFSLKAFCWCADVTNSEPAKSELLLLLNAELKKHELTLE